MRGLQPPPKEDSPSRLVGRMVTLIVLVVAAGIVVYTATTNQRIDLTEDVRTVGLNLSNPTVVDGLTVNVVDDQGGTVPVVLLHDVDVAGALNLADLSAGLGEPYRGARVDLPGYGYSDRLPNPGPPHTAASMADVVASVIEQRYGSGALIVGVGMGGKVAADLAVSYPHLVQGLVMVDVDFDETPSLEVAMQSLPWVGRAATYTWETGGRFAADNWSPYCERGGWCPTPNQLAERVYITTIANTTDSIYAFRRTPEAALAPSNLSDVTVPMAYVWSKQGEVSSSTVEAMTEEIPGLKVIESDTFQAHLQDRAAIVAALTAVNQ